MTLAIDDGDVAAIRRRLSVAAEDAGEAVPTMPSAGAFGPAVLGSAVAAFEAAMRREAERLTKRWADLETGVRDTFADLSAVEEELTAGIGRLGAAIGPGAGGSPVGAPPGAGSDTGAGPRP